MGRRWMMEVMMSDVEPTTNIQRYPNISTDLFVDCLKANVIHQLWYLIICLVSFAVRYCCHFVTVLSPQPINLFPLP